MLNFGSKIFIPETTRHSPGSVNVAWLSYCPGLSLLQTKTFTIEYFPLQAFDSFFFIYISIYIHFLSSHVAPILQIKGVSGVQHMSVLDTKRHRHMYFHSTSFIFKLLSFLMCLCLCRIRCLCLYQCFILKGCDCSWFSSAKDPNWLTITMVQKNRTELDLW
jgi:hypothetical protein